MFIDIYDFELTIWQKRQMPQARAFTFHDFYFIVRTSRKRGPLGSTGPKKRGPLESAEPQSRGGRKREGGGKKVRGPQKCGDPESAGPNKAWGPRKRSDPERAVSETSPKFGARAYAHILLTRTYCSQLQLNCKSVGCKI